MEITCKTNQIQGRKSTTQHKREQTNQKRTNNTQMKLSKQPMECDIHIPLCSANRHRAKNIK
ncbi:hypothetical protein T265_04130 [Opisthorchis viverrini]|uniref:Uncharacterized protein n=1 Tax=Opisthorchis viverrini TaxID=6198 RepID=A0A074ZTS6_OPIVI|nr:hypothetical protein T265_04130 [Opisthorchis viverrini]KER29197.1 hypothetical protein T265_04130 [Opisthorchis viverrini]